jgi:two-component system, NarL family, sensor histidine kinase DesK
LAAVDDDRAGREAAEVRRLAATTLAELREVVHGYRRVDLGEQLAAIAEVLRSSGVRCTVEAGEVAAEPAGLLSAVLREATTNLLRHSRATWCAIEIQQTADEVRMTITNDGVSATASPDAHSHGLRGLADRLAEAGGVLRTRAADGRFVVEAVVPSKP